RRSVYALPVAFYLARKNGVRFLFSHSKKGVGGEISVPFFPTASTEKVFESLNLLGSCPAVISSKLHPGIISLSMGGSFYSVGARPKTRAFLEEYSRQGIIEVEELSLGVTKAKMKVDDSWQKNIWSQYREFLSDSLGSIDA